MRFTQFVTAALAGASAVQAYRPVYKRDTQDAPAMKKAIQQLSPGFKALDTAISGITATNVKQQLTVVKSKADDLSKIAVTAAGQLKATQPISMISALTLMTPITNLFKDLNSTAQHIMEKAPIIMEANAVDTVVDIVKGGLPGIKSMTVALIGQIPASITSQIETMTQGLGFSLPKTEADMDSLFKQAEDLIAGMLGGAGAAPGAPKGAPKESAPKDAAVPKGAPKESAPKGAPRESAPTTPTPKDDTPKEETPKEETPKEETPTSSEEAAATPTAAETEATEAAETPAPKATTPKGTTPAPKDTTPATPEPAAPEPATPAPETPSGGESSSGSSGSGGLGGLGGKGKGSKGSGSLGKGSKGKGSSGKGKGSSGKGSSKGKGSKGKGKGKGNWLDMEE